MFDIAREVLDELGAGRAVGVVVVTAVFGSAPRAVGSAMAVTEDGRAIGSVSGGCVEAEAYELARAALATGERATARLGGPDDPFAAGLSCGGTLEVATFRLGGGDAADAGIVGALERALGEGEVTLDIETGMAAFSLFRPRMPRMIVVGAVDFSGALADAARLLAFRVTVVDHRPVFATRPRFPSAADVVVAWPDAFLRELAARDPLGAEDAVCVLTHQERLDVPALVEALASGAGYVGAMGSRGTHERRLAALVDAGVGADALARLRSPIGLDLGGSTPAETAVAIVAEIVALRHRATAVPLSHTAGPIHAAPLDRTRDAAAHAGTPASAALDASRHTLSRDIGSS